MKLLTKQSRLDSIAAQFENLEKNGYQKETYKNLTFWTKPDGQFFTLKVFRGASSNHIEYRNYRSEERRAQVIAEYKANQDRQEALKDLTLFIQILENNGIEIKKYDEKIAANKAIYQKLSESINDTFDSWQETHFEIVQSITIALEKEEKEQPITLQNIVEHKGTAGLYEFARDLTNQFEEKFRGVVWGTENSQGEEQIYFDEMEKFINEKIY